MNFSIVVPAYNEEAHYPSTLESIVAAAETLRSISGACVEILVVYNNKDNEMAWIGEDVDFYWALKEVGQEGKRQRSIDSEPRVQASSRRFDQWSVWKTLIWTNPFFIALLRRRKWAWGGWYSHPVR